MIKVVYGNKGIGKTKYLVANANALLNDCMGDVVFIHRDNSLITDLKHEIRYVDTSEFPVTSLKELMAFMCGLIAQNYDIKAIFVDGLANYRNAHEKYQEFFDKIQYVAEKFETRFIFSISGDVSSIPDYVNKEYSC